MIGFFDMWQKMIRHFVAMANKSGFEVTHKEIGHHQKALRMIRRTASSRFHMSVQTYAYLRYANHRKYYSEAVAVIRLEYQLEGVRTMALDSEIKKAPTGAVTPGASSNTGRCPWCNSSQHSGGKSKCPFASRFSHKVAVMLTARAEQRGGAFAGVVPTVIKEHLAEKEKEKEREQEKNKEKTSDTQQEQSGN